MAFLSLAGTHRGPITAPLAINTSNRLGGTITQAFLVGGSLRNLCGGERVTLGGGGSLIYGADYGIALVGSGSAQGATVAVDLSRYTKITLAFRMSWDSYANDYKMALEYSADGVINAGFFLSPNSASGTSKVEIAVSTPTGAAEIARPSAATWHQYHITLDRDASGADLRLYVNGIPVSTTATRTGVPGGGFSNSTLYIFGRNNESLFGAGKLQNLLLRGNTILSAAEIFEEFQYPKAAFKGPVTSNVYFLPSAGGGGATIAGDSGTYTLTGSDVSLKAGRKLAADSGTYSLTGTAAALRVGRKLAADSGSYSLSGTDAAFKRGYALAASSGTYTVSGTAVSLKSGRKLAADSGSYTLTGTDATLTYAPAGSYNLTAESGSYSLTGTAATLKVSRKLSADSGAYSLTGTTATLAKGVRMAAASGSYTLTGSNVSFARTYVLTAESGSYTLTGTSAGLTWSGAPVVEVPTNGGPSIYGKPVFREREFRREYEEQVKRIEDEKRLARILREDEEIICIMALMAA